VRLKFCVDVAEVSLQSMSQTRAFTQDKQLIHKGRAWYSSPVRLRSRKHCCVPSGLIFVIAGLRPLIVNLRLCKLPVQLGVSTDSSPRTARRMIGTRKSDYTPGSGGLNQNPAFSEGRSVHFRLPV
jgi:hypothetical protein